MIEPILTKDLVMKKLYRMCVTGVFLAAVAGFGIATSACTTKNNKLKEPQAAETELSEDVQNEAAGESDNRIEEAMQKDPSQPAGSTVMSSDIIPKNGKPTLIDFSATWCPPCRAMKPVFEELSDTYEDYINFVTIDIDEYGELANDYAVSAVPTFIFLNKKGEEVDRIMGAVDQSTLENAINKTISR